MTTVSYRKSLSANSTRKSAAPKSLLKGFKRGSGRNSYGRITTRHKGGGHKRRLRAIDFSRLDKKDIPAKITSVEYDPNRSSFIALITYADGEKRFILAPNNIEVGSKVITGDDAPLKVGNRLPLSKVALGTEVYNIETNPEGGAKLVRSAGATAQVTSRDAGYVSLKLPSGEVRQVPENCYATIGQLSNTEHKLRRVGKAGRSRHLGKRPTVRGTAMNPVDHPMGGGEARSRGSRKHKKTKWGQVVDPGMRTRRPGKYSDYLIVTRRKSRKRK